MTGPNEIEDIEVPLRLQPVVARPEGWRGRSINLIAVGLVAFVALGIVLGSQFDNGGPSSSAAAVVAPGSTASPDPTRGPTPTRSPLSTPLPPLEIGGAGAARPDEHRLVWGNGQEILDLGSGTTRSFGRLYEDILWPIGDEIVCICLVRVPGGPTDPPPFLRFARFDLDGNAIFERELVTLTGVEPVFDMTEGFNVTAAIDAARERAVVVDVVRRPPEWAVELHVVDVQTGTLLDSAVLDSFPVDLEEPRPSASPRTDGGAPDGVYAWGSWAALAPDGRSAYVTVSRFEVRGDEWTGGNLEWLVPIDGDALGEATQLGPEASLNTDRWCLARPTYLDPELVVQVCGPPSAPFETTFWSVRRVTTDGQSLGDLPIGAAQSDGGSAAAIAVDPARRAVYLWDPLRHLLSRVDVDDGGAHEGVVPESMLPVDREPPARWGMGVEPGLVASPDGTRLFALGITPAPGDTGRSTGVWVFDAETLELLDHWAPRALLTSLAVSADGRFVYAAGAAGYDADGNANQRWPASLTVYDAMTGEIAVLYGAVGSEGQWFSFQADP